MCQTLKEFFGYGWDPTGEHIIHNSIVMKEDGSKTRGNHFESVVVVKDISNWTNAQKKLDY